MKLHRCSQGRVRDRAGTGPRHDQLVWTYPLQEGPGYVASILTELLTLCAHARVLSASV